MSQSAIVQCPREPMLPLPALCPLPVPAIQSRAQVPAGCVLLLLLCPWNHGRMHSDSGEKAKTKQQTPHPSSPVSPRLRSPYPRLLYIHLLSRTPTLFNSASSVALLQVVCSRPIALGTPPLSRARRLIAARLPFPSRPATQAQPPFTRSLTLHLYLTPPRAVDRLLLPPLRRPVLLATLPPHRDATLQHPLR